MQNLEVGLFERSEHGHLRLVGVTCDQAVVNAACDRIAEEHRNELAQLGGSSSITRRERATGGAEMANGVTTKRAGDSPDSEEKKS